MRRKAPSISVSRRFHKTYLYKTCLLLKHWIFKFYHRIALWTKVLYVLKMNDSFQVWICFERCCDHEHVLLITYMTWVNTTIVYKNFVIVQYGFGSTKLCVWWYVHYWDMDAACYAFVAGATFRDPSSVILIGIGSCVLRLSAGATSRIPILVCEPFGGAS